MRFVRGDRSWLALALALVLAVVTVVPMGTSPSAGAAVGYRALTPARILDTRATGPVGADAAIDVKVTGVGGVPESGVGAVVLNVTSTGATADTWVTVWPTGASRPEASNLNVAAGETRPNLVIATVGDAGRVSLYNFAGSTDLIADVTGWFPAGSDYSALTPARILDTRATGPVGADASIDVKVTGVGGVPESGVGAVVLNVTSTNASAGTWVTAWPTGTTRPDASSLNVRAGRSVPNLVIATVGDGGRVSLYNFAGSTDLIADVTGWFPAGSDYSALTPARILDTRATGPVGADASIDVKVTGVGGVPESGVGAVVLNVTSTNATADTWATIWPAGLDRPEASNLNVAAGVATPNAVIATVGAGGYISLYNFAGTSDYLVDVTGWLPGTPAGSTDAGVLFGEGVGQLYRLDLDEPAGDWVPRGTYHDEFTVVGPRNEIIRGETWPSDPFVIEVRDLGTFAVEDSFEWPTDAWGVDEIIGSNDGTYLAAILETTSSDRWIEVLRRGDRTVIRRGLDNVAESIAFTPDNDLVVAFDEGPSTPAGIGVISHEELTSGDDQVDVTLYAEFETFEGSPSSLAVSPDGSQVVFTRARMLWALDLAPGAAPHQLTSGPDPHIGAAFSPDGTQIAFTELSISGTHQRQYIIPNHRGAPILIDGVEGTVAPYEIANRNLVRRIITWLP